MGTAISYCGCVQSADKIVVKSGQKQKSYFTRLPLFNRTAGAEYQDARYGKGMRVFNLMKRAQNEQQRGCCSVCATVRGL